MIYKRHTKKIKTIYQKFKTINIEKHLYNRNDNNISLFRFRDVEFQLQIIAIVFLGSQLFSVFIRFQSLLTLYIGLHNIIMVFKRN